MIISIRAYKNELIKLFKEVFSEESRFTEMVFEEKLCDSKCFCIKENQKIVSFLYAIEKLFKSSEQLYKCVYIYGVGTKSEHRKKGYAKVLLNEAYEFFKDKDVKFLYLVPAFRELFSMYERFGYRTEFYLEKKVIELKKSADIKVSGGDCFADYKKFAEKKNNIILNSERDIKTTLKYAKYIKVGQSGFIYEEDGETVHIREAYQSSEADLENLLLHFGKSFKTAVVTTEGKLPYAMVKPYGDFTIQGPRYTNLNLD